MIREARKSSAVWGPGRIPSGHPIGPLCGIFVCLQVAFGAFSASAAADNCPNATVRDQQGSGFLSDCRAYEKVSPAEKNGADMENTGYTNTGSSPGTRAAASGDAVVYFSKVPFTGASGSLFQNYFSSHQGGNWAFDPVHPTFEPIAAAPASQPLRWLSPDASTAILETYGGSQLVPGSPQIHNLFARDNTTGTFSLITDPTVPVSPVPHHTIDHPVFAAANHDSSHVVFGYDANVQLTEDAPLGSFGQENIYEWADGTLRLATILPDESPVPAGDAIPGGGDPELLIYPGDNLISDDGSRLYFTVKDLSFHSGDLYMRENGTNTVRVDASERTDCADDPVSCTGAPSPDPNPAPTFFKAASADGSTALFVSAEELTDDSSAADAGGGSPGTYITDVDGFGDLYRWDVEAPVGERLTDLTAVPGGGRVVGVVGASEDVSRIYFVALSELAPGATAGEPNLYLWEQGNGLRHIATLDDTREEIFEGEEFLGFGPSLDIAIWTRIYQEGEISEKGSRVTPDGRHVLIASHAQLTDYDTDGHQQFYLYDAVEDQLTCVSCNPRAQSSSSDVVFARPAFSLNQNQRFWLTRNVSDDGARVFFQSREALLPDDSNGKFDVYQWENGQVSLISTGQSDEESRFLDASASGDDVFFVTRERLVSADRDTLYDVYDARVEGGFPEPPPAPPACEGDACQPPPVSPHDPTPASSGFSGDGNQRTRAARRARCAKGKVRRGRRCIRKRRGHPTRRQSRAANTNGRAGR